MSRTLDKILKKNRKQKHVDIDPYDEEECDEYLLPQGLDWEKALTEGMMGLYIIEKGMVKQFASHSKKGRAYIVKEHQRRGKMSPEVMQWYILNTKKTIQKRVRNASRWLKLNSDNQIKSTAVKYMTKHYSMPKDIAARIYDRFENKEMAKQKHVVSNNK